MASPIVTAIKNKTVDLVVQLPSPRSTNDAGDRIMRRIAVDHAIPLLTNLKLTTLLADSLERHSRTPMVGLIPQVSIQRVTSGRTLCTN